MRPQLEPIGEENPKMAQPKSNPQNGAVTVTITSIISILLSIPIILSGVYLAFYQPENSCLKILHWPLLLLGAAVSVTALIGLLGSIWRLTWLVILYFLAMSAAIAALGVVVVSVYVATNVKNSDDGDFGALAGEDTYPSSDYRLDDFSSRWFRRRVEGVRRWDEIRECLNSAGACTELNQRYRNLQDFQNAQLSPIEEGCCKPPKECGYTFVNPTYWTNPANTAGGIDCLLWSNNQTELCYQCSMCKAGFLASVRKQWRTVDFVLFVAFVGLVSMFLFGCCCGIWKARLHGGDGGGRENDCR
ncbi:hypothetical protein V2J09_020348 [Rumex salicifolius]